VYTLGYATTPAHNTIAVTGGSARIANFALVDPLRVLAVSGNNLVLISCVGSINAQSWREDETISLSAPTVDLPAGETTTAQGWQISDNGSSDWTNFTPSTANISDDGKYLRYYATFSGGQTHYSNTVNIRVYASDFHPNEVTILMRDSYSDGWDGSGALRINVNGTDLANNARLSSGGSGSYTFAVNQGDVVIIYWVSGTNLNENAFAVYYTSDQPNPVFNPTAGATVDTGRLLVYRQYSSMGSVTNGAELGRFTVP
jgi:hypothetical protein